MAGNEKNLVLAIVLSAIILLGWTFFVQAPKQRERAAQQEIAAQQLPVPEAQVAGDPSVPLPEGAVPGGVVEGVIADRVSVIEAGGRIKLASPQLSGSISLAGGRIDDLVLNEFRETVAPDSKNIALFSPEGSQNPYFAEFGWVDQQGAAYGSGQTAWSGPSGAVLAPGRPVTLTWENDEGLALSRVYE
ncbi:MAG: membrane protein insertase YidC, partial [Alphaproteobacteria bacterium]